MKFGFFIIVPQFHEALFIFFSHCFSDGVNSIDLSWSSLFYPLSFPLNYRAHPVRFFSVIVSFSFIISVCFFFITLFLCWHFLFFICFKRSVTVYWITFIINALKALSNNSNICFTCVAVSWLFFFFFSLKLCFSWFLVEPVIFSYKT